MATHAIDTGATLDASTWARVRVPPAARPADALFSLDGLPVTWEAGRVEVGTTLSESILAGSPASRALSAGEAQLVLPVSRDQAIGVEPGDVVDVWAAPGMCEGAGCVATLLAAQARITSVVVDSDSPWGALPSARVGIVLQAVETDRVLGHTGSGTINLVLRPPGTAPHPQNTGDSS